MAHLTTCLYCGGNVINRSFHAECRAAFCEDLLAQIKKRLRDFPDNALTDEFVTALKNEYFETKIEYDELVRKTTELKLRKNSWILERDAVLQKAALEWEKNNPDPNPPRY